MRTLPIVTVAASLLGITPVMTQSQAVRVGSEVTCASCVIVVDSTIALKGPAINSAPSIIERDSEGTIYLVDRPEGLLKVFDSSGRFQRRIGRRGGGPGEYENIDKIIIAPDGSIIVLDAALGRRSVFGRDGAFVRSYPLQISGAPRIPSAAFLTNGQLIINAHFRRAAEAGFALQSFDEKGIGTGMADEGVFNVRESWLQERLLWARRNGELLVANPYSFKIDVYVTGFLKRLSIVRAADWLPPLAPGAAPEDGRFDAPFTPQLRGIWESSDGILWLLLIVPSPSWKPVAAPPKGTPMTSESLLELIRRPRTQTVIEAVDLERRRVLARIRIEGPAGVPFGGGYLAKYVEDPGGEPGVQLLRVRLKR